MIEAKKERREQEERLRLDRVSLLEASPNHIPTKLEDIAREWELVLSTVPHGIFCSSPFFLAIQE
jgi:hypothetical protein